MDWWLWLAGGLVLLLIELMTPGGFVTMFFGLAAMTVGVLARLGIVEVAWLQWLLFSLLSVVFLLAFRGRLQRQMRPSFQQGEMDSLVGTLAVAQERLLPNSVGRVEARGSAWTARNAADVAIEPGARCRVLRVDGLLLLIRPE